MRQWHPDMTPEEEKAFLAECDALDKAYADAAETDERRAREYRASWEVSAHIGTCVECSAPGLVDKDDYCFGCAHSEDPADFYRGALDHRGRP